MQFLYSCSGYQKSQQWKRISEHSAALNAEEEHTLLPGVNFRIQNLLSCPAQQHLLAIETWAAQDD